MVALWWGKHRSCARAMPQAEMTPLFNVSVPALLLPTVSLLPVPGKAAKGDSGTFRELPRP